MRCSKCSYISFDHLTSCSKCGNDLAEISSRLMGTAVKTVTSFFLGSVFGQGPPERPAETPGGIEPSSPEDMLELDLSPQDETDGAGEIALEPSLEIELREETTSGEAGGIIMPDLEEGAGKDEIPPPINLDQFKDTAESNKPDAADGITFPVEEPHLELSELTDELKEEQKEEPKAGIEPGVPNDLPSLTDQPRPILDEAAVSRLADTDGSISAPDDDIKALQDLPAVESLPESGMEGLGAEPAGKDVMSLVAGETRLYDSDSDKGLGKEGDSEQFEADGDDKLADLSEILDDLNKEPRETDGDTLDLGTISLDKLDESGSELDLATLPDISSLELDLSLEDQPALPEGGPGSKSGEESVTSLPDITELDLMLEDRDDD